MSEKEKGFQGVIFFCLLAAFLAIRTFILVRYSFTIIDSDQPYMWLGASDYARGLFFEPRYYGQGYNTFMEGFFAVPFMWAKIPVYYAVPLATQVIAIFPVIFAAFYLNSVQKRTQAIIVLLFILCIPAPYDLLNSIPRGFVTGIFFTSFFIVSIHHPGNRAMLAFNTVMATAGYFINPNSALISVPFMFYLFLHNYRNVWYYAATGTGLLFIIPFYLLFDRLYVLHPEYIINPLNLRFSTDFFMSNISALDERFGHITPFTEYNCLILIALLIITGVALHQQNKKAFCAFTLFILLILISFCFGKTLEGDKWVYMSFSRMYLGIPILMGMFISLLSIKINRWLLLLPLVFVIFKIAKISDTLSPHFNKYHWVGVRLLPLPDALKAIDVYRKKCNEYNSPLLLVSHGFWMNTIIAYGGPATGNFPSTQETRLEKRFWVKARNNDVVFENVMLISTNFELDNVMPRYLGFDLERVDGYGLFLFKNNKLPTGKLIDLVNTFEDR